MSLPIFKVTTDGKDELGIRELVERYANNFWLADVSADQAEAVILDSFKRKLAGELELISIEPIRGEV